MSRSMPNENRCSNCGASIKPLSDSTTDIIMRLHDEASKARFGIINMNDDQAEYARQTRAALEDKVKAMVATEQSLRAECGLRQIQGYNEGKAAARKEIVDLLKESS